MNKMLKNEWLDKDGNSSIYTKYGTPRLVQFLTDKVTAGQTVLIESVFNYYQEDGKMRSGARVILEVPYGKEHIVDEKVSEQSKLALQYEVEKQYEKELLGRTKDAYVAPFVEKLAKTHDIAGRNLLIAHISGGANILADMAETKHRAMTHPQKQEKQQDKNTCVVFVRPGVGKAVKRPDGKIKGYRLEWKDVYTGKQQGVFLPVKADGISVQKINGKSKYNGWLLVKMDKNTIVRNGPADFDYKSLQNVVKKLNKEVLEKTHNEISR